MARRLEVEYELNFWDGPVEFFAKLDGRTVYCKVMDHTLQKDDRCFRFWHVTGDFPRDLMGPESGRFTSTDVEWAA